LANAVKKLGKGDILFREGDASDAMYVIKSGRIAITKLKGAAEIPLAEKGPGEMFGEMAFFDNKARSAGAKAMTDAEVIVLPFSALYAQFKTFPEWLRAMVKTVNTHLREANMRIKNLETVQSDDKEIFPPYTITRLMAILTLVGHKFGEKTAEGMVVPASTLRNYTIQVFQQPTNKMQKLMETLKGMNMMNIEDIGEGRQKLTILKFELLSKFVDWYNQYLFTEESKRTTLEENELKVVRALLYYGRKLTPDKDGKVLLSITGMQNDSMRDLGFVCGIGDVDSLIEKAIIGDKMMDPQNNMNTTFEIAKLEDILPFWEIVYTLRKVSK
jgi:CRP/FNR family cyclic AMP-dependent transcriptional regulator